MAPLTLGLQVRQALPARPDLKGFLVRQARPALLDLLAQLARQVPLAPQGLLAPIRPVIQTQHEETFID